MSQQPFDYITNRMQTHSVKWDNVNSLFGGEDLLPMWVADMDFPAPPAVQQALEKALKHGIFGYTVPNNETSDAILEWLENRHDWKAESDWIVYSPGVVFSISMAIQAFTNEKDPILIQTPVYSPFFNMIKENGRTLIENPLILQDDRYKMDFADLEEKLAQGVKMMILCSPHNPGGRVWTAEELQRVYELCQRHGVILLSDEIHADLVYKPHKHIPIASLHRDGESNIITFIAPSKTFNLAGLQASAVIIDNKELREKYNRIQRKQGFFSLNLFGIVGMEAAYRGGEGWLENLLSYLQDNIQYASDFIRNRLPKLKLVEPEGTYLIWIDCRGLGLSDAKIRTLLLEKGKLAVEPGTKYGRQGSGFIRLNIGCPRELLKDGLDRLYRAFSDV
ncbi:MalY/PatB family protein [Bacillus songklensis]|uniref:cysteine-S-conjugate beta-lyase n=1 Tax=Bacillus songklensis TaxID=1069116 RepID=A0ABV8BCC0_9BACI